MSDYQAKWNLASSVEDDQQEERSIGRILQAAREDQNFSVSHVAEEMYLRSELIIALENDDYSDMPAAYTRGYIRSYAKFLGIDQSIVQEKLSVDEKVHCPSVSQPMRKSSGGIGGMFLRTGFGLVLTALLIAAGIWLFYPQSDGNGAANFTAFDFGEQIFNPVPGEEADAGSVLPSNAVENLENTIIEEQPVTINSEMAQDPANHNRTVVGNVEIDSVREEALVDTDSDRQGSTEQLDPEANNSTVIFETNVAESQSVNILDEADQLTVQYIEASWTVITDAQDRELLHGLYKQGSVRTISGEAPFSIFLGNSPGVVISINGKKFDQSRFTRSNRTARFQLTDSNT